MSSRVLCSSGSKESLKIVLNQVSIRQGVKARRHYQVTELSWREKEGRPWELDMNRLRAAPREGKPGRLICCCLSGYNSLYFFPTDEAVVSWVLDRTAWEMRYMWDDRKGHCNRGMRQSRKKRWNSWHSARQRMLDMKHDQEVWALKDFYWAEDRI